MTGGAEDHDPVRNLLRDLPEVAPPEGFLAEVVRRRRRRRRALVLGGLAAAAVVGTVVVAGASGITGSASPVLDDLMGHHRQVAGDTSSPMPTVAADDVPAPFQVPERLGELERGFAVEHPDDVVQVLYTSGGVRVSVFEHPGELDVDAMPGDLHHVDVDGDRAWVLEDEGMTEVVVRRDDMVYVLVGDAPAEDLASLSTELPDGRPLGVTDRLRDAMDDLVATFGFG